MKEGSTVYWFSVSHYTTGEISAFSYTGTVIGQSNNSILCRPKGGGVERSVPKGDCFESAKERSEGLRQRLESIKAAFNRRINELLKAA